MTILSRFCATILGIRLIDCCTAFLPGRPLLARTSRTPWRETMACAAYVPLREGDNLLKKNPTTKPLHPSMGDIVRYYDLDGGRLDGQILVGKITYIQPSSKGWLVEVMPLEDVGDGYFAEYSSRRGKRTLRELNAVSPIMASFVQSENAYKLPMQGSVPKVRAETYDVDDYEGPVRNVNEEIVATDLQMYGAIKNKMFKVVAVTGLLGTVGVDLIRGTEDAVIYGAGALSSLVYLFLLSVKTDTIASPEAKLGKGVANLRFAMPLIVLLGVALYNQSRGDASNPVAGKGTFDYVTAEQFGAAILGFLTYRLPLFAVQLQEAFQGNNSNNESDQQLTMPGSVGLAMKLAQTKETDAESLSLNQQQSGFPTILLVSGPQATGRTELVKRLLAEGDGRYVEPDQVDQLSDPATYERLAQRNELLIETGNSRYGMTQEGILVSARAAATNNAVVVVDASVELSKQLTRIPGLRIIGVWVGLNSVEEFETRVGAAIDSGDIVVEETRESTLRSTIRQVVKEVEYGISSGVFEFTVLNDNEEKSLEQLKEAAAYCFK